MTDSPDRLPADAPVPVRIRVLGCSGSIAADRRTTSFLLDDTVLIDAGTGVGDLTLEELARIDDIVLTHAHLDHVLALPLLADSILAARMRQPERGPLRVYALPETLETLRAHLLNGQLWPDFTRLPSAAFPILQLRPCHVGDQCLVGRGAAARTLWVLPATHPVPACGFGIDTAQGWWIFTGDTGPNPALWPMLRGRQIAHLVIETSFRNAQRALADLSGHLVPSSLADELAHLDGAVLVHVTHCKPGDAEVIDAELRELVTPHQIRVLARGHLFTM